MQVWVQGTHQPHSIRTYSILCRYPHIKPRDYTKLTQKSRGNLC
ncbi:MAG: hypothetical protein GIS02_01690 [Methanosarcinales archaeon]|uniref:Uncharacterized protein n=1 Tax=Candidatus Ethanoperedens thermophilum TaxID=2766897 RepID=A0A848D9K9_9EURY|nr:hypothetical protein [Candidatus Ethanoperedens thermophilum]